MPLLLFVLACLRTDPRPDAGDCASYPDGSYTWGEIGIGTCLAGPQTLRFVGDASDPTLLVTNANPYLSFTGGSVLAIPWSDVDMSQGKNMMSDLDAHAVDLPDFAAGLAIQDDLGIVGVRLSADARTRAYYDDAYLLDLSDPTTPALSDLGVDGSAKVEVQSDPVDVAVDPTSGFAYVGNRTSHTISVVDLSSDPIEAMAPWPYVATKQSPFFDTDASGSRAELATLTVTDDTLLPDDTWSFDWVEGLWRVWTPAEDAIQRYTYDGSTLRKDNLGHEMSVDDFDGDISEVNEPAYQLYGTSAKLYFSNEGEIYVADSVPDDGDFLGQWTLETDPVLAGSDGDWDATMSGPETIIDNDGVYWLFYDGTDGTSWGIGAAKSTDGASYRKVAGPLLTPTYDHESARISDPYVIWDSQIDRYRMYYSAYDGVNWTIGHAVSADLQTWTPDATPVFAPVGAGAAAPVVAQQDGLFRMWYARQEANVWSLGAATSVDGTHWTDLGNVAALEADVSTADDPPGPALQAAPEDAFDVSGENTGRLFVEAAPGFDYDMSETLGWVAHLVAGYQISPLDGGDDSWGGIQIDSIDADDGLAWLSMTNRDGVQSIGVATMGTDGRWQVQRGPVLAADDSGFDKDGVWSPTVIKVGSEFWMYYAGLDSADATIGLATSSDGITWTKQGQVLDLVTDAWDGAGLVPGSVETLDDGSYRLWYTGTNGSIDRIGSATSTDGVSWTREEESSNKPWAFASGAPGDWDDSGVRDPYVVKDADGEHLWYAGYDGGTWRAGYAFRATETDSWTRSSDETLDESRAVIGSTTGLFHADGVQRPVAQWDGSQWDVWFAGLDGDVAREGLALGDDPDRLHEAPRRPTPGDSLQFVSERGDEDTEAIPLDTTVDGRTITGEGLSSVLYDADRGFLYVASTHVNYITVVDVRDDSADGAPDTNYLDIEGILVSESADGGAGFRSMAIDGHYLYALNDSPEAVWVFDLDKVIDNDKAESIYDAVVGYLPASQALDGDQGVGTASSVGPGGLALHPDGQRMFVTNFNANSMTVFDRTEGAFGAETAEITDIGENPYAIALSPDGKYAVVANYTGEVNDDNETSGTLAVVDIDEDSPTYLEVLTWLANR